MSRQEGTSGSRAKGRPEPTPAAAASNPLEEFFTRQGYAPYPFQAQAWAAFARGESGLISVATGAGKTYAAYGGPLAELAKELPSAKNATDSLRVLYITPLRAVSRDIEKALRAPVELLGLPIEVGSRTGDTVASERTRQRKRLPEVLITTPESLSLLLTRENASELFAGLRAVIVDEWHELMSTKRGIQVELGLARLRRFAPRLRTWALSATIANPERAARLIMGVGQEPSIVRAELPRPIEVDSLLPAHIERFPWSGHLGLAMLEPLLSWLDPTISTLLFTNTRSQAERWFAEIYRRRPEWAERLALHHGSIDREVREEIEARVKDGRLTMVVCTSSLDLGVDFSPVERVVQIGSPKGVARLIQRAGRSGHRPGATCRVLCLPTHALELVEIAAARQAVTRGEIEERPSVSRPLDCLVQHLVTCGLGGGFRADELFDEVRTSAAFADLSRGDFDWCLDLVTYGGTALQAYPQFHRLSIDDAGRYVVTNKRIAQIHRLNVGTIASDATITVKWASGGTIGVMEEDFIARLRPGDTFLFAGRALEFVRVRDLAAHVKPARRHTGFTAHWAGSRFPLSTALAKATRRVLDAAAHGRLDEPEVRCAALILQVQAELSRIPRSGEILVERTHTQEGHHLFVYPFEGRLVHEGLAVLVALRLGRIRKATFAISMNDYGFELLTTSDYPFHRHLTPELFAAERLYEDLLESVNLGELGLRQFREVARVAGLIMQRYPGAEKSGRQVQAGASLLWEVLTEFDGENLLLQQARREVMDRQFEESRLARTLRRLREEPLTMVELATPGPLALPLVADRLGTSLSTESLIERLAQFRASAAR
ncbi:MAG: ligase-associated DNA damage response DEXH box helicase [Phycisphaerae bacterium]|nr:ligase-associated DNA damage response DEXH box helicase [Phycisphaerae bacterium]